MIKSGSGPSIFHDGTTLVQLKVSVENQNRFRTETIFAERVGPNLYKVRGPLHLIANLNSDDLVTAEILPEESIPTVSKVVQRSGYRTVHFVFRRSTSPSEQKRTLMELADRNTRHEMVFDRFYTLEVPPDGDYDGVLIYLHQQKARNLLEFEPALSLDELLRFCFLGDSFN